MAAALAVAEEAAAEMAAELREARAALEVARSNSNGDGDGSGRAAANAVAESDQVDAGKINI